MLITPPIRIGRRLAGAGLVVLLAGCAGDGILLPNDGVAAELRVVSGDRQSALAGDPVEEPLVVEALDRVGRPVPGAVVVFEFVDPPAGAEIAPATPETDAAGRAQAQVKLGTLVGDQAVLARLDDPGSDLSVQFRLTALQRRGGGGDDGDGDGGGGGDGDDGGGDGDDGEGEDGGGEGDGPDDGPGGGGGGPDGDDGDDKDDDRDDEGKDDKDDKGKDDDDGGPGREGDDDRDGDDDDRDDDDRDDDDRDGDDDRDDDRDDD